jgi:hypothetical protein
MVPTRTRPATDGPERALRIDDGRVACPRRGRVDISRCWSCVDYRGLSSGHIEALVCGASDPVEDDRIVDDRASRIET